MCIKSKDIYTGTTSQTNMKVITDKENKDHYLITIYKGSKMVGYRVFKGKAKANEIMIKLNEIIDGSKTKGGSNVKRIS